jgi:hypothetical protein
MCESKQQSDDVLCQAMNVSGRTVRQTDGRLPIPTNTLAWFVGDENTSLQRAASTRKLKQNKRHKLVNINFVLTLVCAAT